MLAGKQVWKEEKARERGEEALAMATRRHTQTPHQPTMNTQRAHPTHRQNDPVLPTQLDPDDDSDLGTDTTEDTFSSIEPPQPTEQPGDVPAVRPIQVGEWLRKVITRRIMDADKPAITRKLLQSRQWGIGVSGGAEAIAFTHLLIEDMWNHNKLTKPTAIIQVDQTTASDNSNTPASTRLYNKTILHSHNSHYGSTPRLHKSPRAPLAGPDRPEELNKATWLAHSKHQQL